MALNNAQRRYLRALAHHLDPVVIVGAQGLTTPVMEEVNAALDHHELIKVRVNAPDRRAREAVITQICATTGADHVQTIGHVGVLYRAAQAPRIGLS